jgi:PAS domain S-box-containing protein
MILSTVFVVVITALTVGLPAIWVIRGQLVLQAWEQLQRGRQTVLALYASQQDDLANLATLVAERPTLHTLLVQEHLAELQEYLGALRLGAGVDHILLCGLDQKVIGHSGSDFPDDICAMNQLPALYRLPGEDPGRIILAASHPIIAGSEELGQVLLARDIDQEFINDLQPETGIEQTLLVDGQAVASSLEAEPGELSRLAYTSLETFSSGEFGLRSFDLEGQPYYAVRFPLDQPGLEVELAEGASSIAAAQASLVQSLVVGMLVSASLGILLGVLLSRQISQPLVQLARSATRLSQGDLSQPVAIETDLLEENQVAQALENARVNLRSTLTDLQQEKAWTDQLLRAIIEGIMALDDQQRILFFSHGAERITGWSREEVVGRSCDDVFRLAESETPFSQLLPAPGMKTRLVVELADGHWASLSFSGARLAPSEASEAEAAVVFRDVSAEEIVHNMLGQFTANIAHEFRTPLSAVAASAELLKDQASELSLAELQELTHSIHLGILSLQTLVDNLLEGASIEAGRFRISPRPSSLADIIGEAAATMQPLLDKYGQNLVISLPDSIPPVFADPRRTLQVLVNLISNASKYGPADAEIALCAGVSSDQVRVEVSDQGPGIPPEQRRDLFRRFAYPQATPEHGKVGIGLGLSVVKAVVEAHGGQTGVEDRSQGGSTFWFTLPLAEAA